MLFVLSASPLYSQAHIVLSRVCEAALLPKWLCVPPSLISDARDELKSDQLILTTELNRREARSSKQRQQLMNDLDDRSTHGMWYAQHDAAHSSHHNRNTLSDARSCYSCAGVDYTSTLFLCGCCHLASRKPTRSRGSSPTSTSRKGSIVSELGRVRTLRIR